MSRALIIFGIAASLVASGKNATGLAHALEARYQHAQTLKAIFYERYSDGAGGMASESGTVYFSRPGRMRWEYQSPEDKLFLVDGTNVWFYVPSDRTASRAKLKESSDWRTPLALLTEKANLSQLCQNLQMIDPASAKGWDKPLSQADKLLKCVPKGADASSYVVFEVDPDDRLGRVIIHDAGNTQTEFRFGNWEENIPIPEIKFHFQPPPGVAIVDEQSLADQIR
jgi:outer membrane lipoprotein carrier protein